MGKDTGGFGFTLRSYRRRAGLSQLDLARRSGLSVRAISDLERGRTRWPYQDSLRRLADALLLDGTTRADFIASGGRRLAALTDPTTATGPAAPRPAPGRIVPRQLPAAVPGFTGRDAQLAALSELLDQPGGTAVITAIGGTAGVGNTALAVQWAHLVAAEFPDGQLYVDLRGFDPSGSPMPAAEAVRLFLDGVARAFRLAGLHPGGSIDQYGVAALAGTTAAAAGRMLETLTSAFLVNRAQPGRYSMHDLLRSYAAELAEHHDHDADAARSALTRLFDYYLYLYAAATAMDVVFPAERHRRPTVAPAPTEVPAFATEADAYAWLDAQRAPSGASSATGRLRPTCWPVSASPRCGSIGTPRPTPTASRR